MLARHRSAFLALCFLVPAALAGCTVKDTETETPINTTADATSSSSGGQGGNGGDGGTGGGTGGTGGTGGGTTECVDAQGTGQTAGACDEMNIAPAQGATQCGAEGGPGYRTCGRGFVIFNPGQAEYLYSCLSTIGVQNACDVPPVQDCITKMYETACASTEIPAACESMSMQCGGLDVATCTTDLNPFSAAGLQEIVDCINNSDPNLTCQEAYDACYPQVMSF